MSRSWADRSLGGDARRSIRLTLEGPITHRRSPLSSVVLIACLALLGACTSAGGTSDGPSDGSGTGSTTPPAPRVFERYVALGDSYTAAPLVPDLDAAKGCYRSTNNYPAVLARTIEVKTFVDRSCSGAETTDMAGRQQTGVASLPPQFRALDAATDLVTLGIGGNDFSVFSTLVDTCAAVRSQDPRGAPCRRAMRAGGRDRLLDAVTRTKTRVRKVVAGIRARSPHATILVVGYPQSVPARGTCPALLPLAAGDYPYARLVNLRLTRALQQVAATSKVGYVDVWQASRGHDICSDDPWVNGQYSDFSLAQAFHPFAAEQDAVAALIAHRFGYGG